MEQYGDKVVVPVDVAIEVNGKRKEIAVNKLPTEYSIFDLAQKPWSAMQKLS